MAEGEKTGLQAAVNVARARLAGRPEEEIALAMGKRAEQLALIPSDVAVADALGDDEAAERRGPGRPTGSRNRRTAEWVDHILGRYRSPLLFLAETYTRPVEQLAAELGCDKEKALALQMTAARELAPYVHQKQPVAVEVDARGVVQLVINTGADQALAAPDGGDDAVRIEGVVVKEGNDGSSST